MLYFKIGGVEVHLLKLCGALILFTAVLGIINTSATMWQTFKVLDDAKSCMKYYIDIPLSPEKQSCLESVYKVTGVFVGAHQPNIDTTQYWIALLNPIIILIFWAAVFVIGWMVYNLGKSFIPIEETERKLPEKPKHRK